MRSDASRDPGPLLRIRGSTTLCPQAFPRVLDRVLVLGGTPVSIDYVRRARSQRFDMAVAGLDGMDPALVAARLAAIPSVRSVRLLAGRGRTGGL